jgi:hypothetical protein
MLLMLPMLMLVTVLLLMFWLSLPYDAIGAGGSKSGPRDGLMLTSSVDGAVVAIRVGRVLPGAARSVAAASTSGTLTPVHRWAFSTSPCPFPGVEVAGPAAESLTWLPHALNVLLPCGVVTVPIPEAVVSAVTAPAGKGGALSRPLALPVGGLGGTMRMSDLHQLHNSTLLNIAGLDPSSAPVTLAWVRRDMNRGPPAWLRKCVGFAQGTYTLTRRRLLSCRLVRAC